MIEHSQGKIDRPFLRAGAAQCDITPVSPLFLYGYPHVPRTSNGTNDPLLATGLVLDAGTQLSVFLSADVIFVSNALTRAVRARVSQATGIAIEAILISATHTHSGPVTLSYLTNETDPVVPPPDPAYMTLLEDRLVDCAVAAWKTRRPAEIAHVVANATGVGTNRHHPAGPSDLEVPVLAVRDRENGAFIGVLMVCAMHATVLHEDSTLFSGDFPAFARMYLQETIVGQACPVLFHSGAAGNQSPRHVTTANTFAEAKRLGDILGRSVENALRGARYDDRAVISVATESIDLPPRTPPTITDAETQLAEARMRFDQLKTAKAAPTAIRSAECDVFGAEETLAVARAAAQGRVKEALDDCLPAEIQVIRVGDTVFVAWPGEFFVEFALRLRATFPNARLITLANGELQGYIVTQEAIDRSWYEAGNALLKSPDAGEIFLARTAALLESIGEVRRGGVA